MILELEHSEKKIVQRIITHNLWVLIMPVISCDYGRFVAVYLIIFINCELSRIGQTKLSLIKRITT